MRTKISRVIAFVACFAVATSCGGGGRRSRSEAARVVKEYETTNPDLRKLYNHYPRGSEQFEAACFLLAGLPGKTSNDDREQLETYLGVIDSLAAAMLSGSTNIAMARKSAGSAF